MRCLTIEPITRRIKASGPDVEHWLWCGSCNRFFPLARLGPGESCPFDDCSDYGLDLGLFYWDSHREPEDPRWPRSTAELLFGLKSPEMESFYQARLNARIDALEATFCARSEAPPRYLRPFLIMMSDLCWDLTDPDEEEASFNDELTRELINQLPVWSHTADLSQAAVMLDELRRFFAFASETGALPGSAHAANWQRILADDELIELLQNTMRHDRRLRPASRRGRSSADGARHKRRKPRKRTRRSARR